jgi:pilus assembly protein Flp/PilA
MSSLKSFLRNESGATAIEYGVIAGSLSIAILGAASTLGVTVKAITRPSRNCSNRELPGIHSPALRSTKRLDSHAERAKLPSTAVPGQTVLSPEHEADRENIAASTAGLAESFLGP